MNTARTILQRADEAGIEFTIDGGVLKMKAAQKPPDDLLADIRSNKPAILSLLTKKANDDTAPTEWAAEDWKAFFDERAGIAEHDGGQPRDEAETFAHEACIVEWMNRHPKSSHPSGCARCNQPKEDGRAIIPFGTDAAGSVWLHHDCWRPWYEARRAEAVTALNALGITAPQPKDNAA